MTSNNTLVGKEGCKQMPTACCSRAEPCGHHWMPGEAYMRALRLVRTHLESVLARAGKVATRAGKVTRCCSRKG